MKKTQLNRMTVASLKELAKEHGIRNAAKMVKAKLVEAIHARTDSAKELVKAKVSKVKATVKKKAASVVKAKKEAVKPKTKRVVPARPKKARARIAKPPEATAPVQLPPSPATKTFDSQQLVAHKFDLQPKSEPQPPLPPVEEYLGELPESYGTRRLFLTARDPHWLYAYWDLTWQQMADYRSQSSDGRIVLRVFEKNHPHPTQELTLQHETRDWYIPVPKPATTYSAQLGFWRHDGTFHVVSQSRETATPADSVSREDTTQFVTIPIDISFPQLLQLIKAHMRGGERLAATLHRLQAEGFEFPFRVGVEIGPWSAEQAAELARILGGDVLRRSRLGSEEISEWLRRMLKEQLGSAAFSGGRSSS